jgi:SAM-dependent methyltransferase
MNFQNSSLFSKVKYYLKLSKEMQAHLSKYPNDLPKFQNIFNSTLEKISLNILQFESSNIANSESKIYKFKKIFEERYKNYFLYGEFPRLAYEKPFGYAGDYKIIDAIYQNRPRTVGYDGLWDNYFLQMTASKATRQRKEDLKKIIYEFLKNHRNQSIRIMNLGSGPAREIKELSDGDADGYFSKVIFDCYDFDIRAINYAKSLLKNIPNVNFFQKNAIRLALKRDIKQEVPFEYDLIYSAGLFDYLDEKISLRLIANLKKLLKRDGTLIVANFENKYSNSSAGLMEWVTEWYLIYRTKEELKKIFLDASFLSKNLKIISQQNKVVLYCFAKLDKS